MRIRAHITFVLFLLAGLWAFSAEAQQMQCEVMSIRASISSSNMSPQLNPYRNQLLRPPFSAFTAFELLNSTRVSLSPGNTRPIRLDNSIGGELRFVSFENSRGIFELALRHNRRTLVNTRFRVSSGFPFFIVVPSALSEGTFVLGIVCR